MALNNKITTENKKPSDSAFKQQRLPAWQPILTAGTVLPTFFVIGIAFIPVGIGLLYFSDKVNEMIINYTHCNETLLIKGKGYQETNETCLSIIKNNENAKCFCHIPFTLHTDFKGKVFLYYGLTNYYQNHRRYVKSRDDRQLLGKLHHRSSSDCDPFDKIYDNKTKTFKYIVPCGAIANSLFSDRLTLFRKVSDKKKYEQVPLIRTGIAWNSDKNIKFRNPPGNLKYGLKDYVRPKAWKKNLYELDPTNPDNNGLQNEDLIVWMRTAALPTFRKLYRKIDHTFSPYKNGLLKGDYELRVEYSYDVSAFDSTKRMILSTTSLIGGKNPFLGYAYIVVGCLCLLLGIFLLLVHIKYGKRTRDMINVTPRTPYHS